MGFLKDMKIRGKFKKGRLVNVDELPDSQDRDDMLVSYALENEIPIIVSNQSRVGELKYVDPTVSILRLASNFTLEVKDADTSDGVMIDETVSIEMVGWLKEQGIKIKGGFQ